MRSRTFQAFSRLGNRLPSRLLYLSLAVQLVLSAMIFLFDSGFPAWIMITGWVVLLTWVTVAILHARLQQKAETARRWKEWKRLETLKARLKNRLALDPHLRTPCTT